MNTHKSNRALEKKAPSDPASNTAELAEQNESGTPGGGRGRVDIVGAVPDDIQVDPEITEGHVGYQESGPSELLPTQRIKKH